MSVQFKGQVAFVTGAASGIGRATALSFARHGADLVLADIQTQMGEEVAQEARKLGVKAVFQKCDTANEEDIRQAVSRSQSEFGRLDFAFNNAGIEGTPASTVDCTNENWDRTININLKGVWLCMKYQIPLMLKGGSGSIINCSSIAGLIGFTGLPAYVASKHGVIGLTKTAALELAKTGVRVNAVCPGVIQTPMIDRFVHGDEQARKALVSGEPMGRAGTPDEIAEAVVFLCSPGAGFMTGTIMPIDGGWTAQ